MSTTFKVTAPTWVELTIPSDTTANIIPTHTPLLFAVGEDSVIVSVWNDDNDEPLGYLEIPYTTFTALATGQAVITPKGLPA